MGMKSTAYLIRFKLAAENLLLTRGENLFVSEEILGQELVYAIKKD